MPILQIEHPVRDYERWKAAFDSDPVGREASGMRGYEIYRPHGDRAYIAVDMQFEGQEQAEAFKARLEALWQTPQAALAFSGTPQARIVDVVETKRY
jgi:hypothetical protein